MSLTEEIVSILACPKCRGDLSPVAAGEGLGGSVLGGVIVACHSTLVEPMPPVHDLRQTDERVAPASAPFPNAENRTRTAA